MLASLGVILRERSEVDTAKAGCLGTVERAVLLHRVRATRGSVFNGLSFRA